MNDLQILFKNNALIKAKYDFTVAQNRVLQKSFYEIQKNKVNIAKISLDEMKQLIKNKDYNTIENIKLFLQNLKDNEIMQIQSDGYWIKTSVISAYGYNKEKRIFFIEIPITLLNLIHEYTKTGFTPTDVTKYISLGATNSQRFYELLRMWTGNKKIVEYTVAEIREYLNLQNKYKVFSDFRKRIIEPTVKELSKKHLLEIYRVEYIKTGKSITSIRFYVNDLEPRQYKFKSKQDKVVNPLGFNNFTERSYDYNKLEKQLLGWEE